MTDKRMVLENIKQYHSSLRRRFQSLAARDRKSLMILMLFLGTVAIWMLIWQPVENARKNAQESFISASNTLNWMQSHAQDANAVTYSASKEERPLLSLVTDCAQKYHLSLNHAEPEDTKTLRVSLEKADFNNVMRWLNAMEMENNVRAIKVTMERQEAAGEVNANITLKSP